MSRLRNGFYGKAVRKSGCFEALRDTFRTRGNGQKEQFTQFKVTEMLYPVVMKFLVRPSSYFIAQHGLLLP